jgi:phytoene dehydrogenase-like protein
VAPDLDAVVVGSGPNGLSAALELSRAGLAVEVLEAADVLGGGCRTAELTLPGFRHDVCSTIQSMLPASPFFRPLAGDLARHGVVLLTPPIAFAHPLDGGRAGVVAGSVRDTAARLGDDAAAYTRLMEPLVAGADGLIASVLAPLRSAPRTPLTMARFAAAGLASAAHLAKRFSTPEAKALVAGVCAHAMLPLDEALTAAFGLFLTVTAHEGGWPVVEGGSDRLVGALAALLAERGTTLSPGRPVRRASDLPTSRLTLFDTSPESMVEVMGNALPARYRAAVGRFRHGPGVFKVDWALAGPVPWTSRDLASAGTVHLGGTFDEVAAAEDDVANGRHPQRPYCIVVQASVVDATRAPAGHHTLWAYCHVPNGSNVDMTDAIESQVERFAPGFKDLILARATATAVQSAAHNANYVGGDIAGGAGTLRQTIFRPVVRWNPYRTGAPGVYLCSSSTPPGAGVHGMCGVFAARTALGDLRRRA